MKTENLKSPKFSRRAKILLWLGGAFAAYTIIGFLVVPAVVKAQMLKRLPVMLKRPVEVAGVAVNPYALSLTIRGLAVKENNGAPFAGFEELYARLKFSSFFQHGWAVKEISLTHPFARLVRGRDGGLNFADILATLAAASPPAPPPRAKPVLPLVMIDSLHIDNADVTVDDLFPPAPVHTKLLPITVKLDNLSTVTGARNPYAIHAASDSSEDFGWTGVFTLDPPQVTGHVAIKNLDLKKYSPYLGGFVKAEVIDGRLDEFADYAAGLNTNGPEITLTNGGMLLKAFSVKSTLTGETVVTVPLLSVALSEANLGKKFVHLTSLSTSDGSLLVRREKDGTINLLSLLSTNLMAAAPSTNLPTASQTPWKAVVDEIAVERYAVSVEDKKPAKPASLKVDEISFKAKGLAFPGNNPITTEVVVRLNGAGRFASHGEVRLQPPSADLAMELTDLDLRPFQPYVEDQVKLAIGAGLLSVRGQARYSAEPGSPLASFDGDVTLTNFATTDTIHFQDFVKLDTLAITGIKSTFQPNSVQVQEIKLGGLKTTAIIDSNRQINLLGVLPQRVGATGNAPPSAASPAPSAPAGLGFPVSLGVFIIDNASFYFADQSVEPPCLFHIQQMDGSVKGLSSQADSVASVDLHGRVDDVSTFSVSGTANPLSKDLTADLTIACQNMDLTPFTPYMEKYAGYPMQRGKLRVDLHHDIVARKLSASNHVVIEGLTLGAKNNSLDATHLPVKLGIALLKDRSGNITLDVPLTGSLDNPDFRLMPIVEQVIGNILAKAATSPFTLLGALFGGGEEMSYVDFQPGLSDIPAAEQAKLDKLAKSLYERPALQLEIAAGADPAADVPVLARLKLQDQIRSLRAKELIAAGNPAENVQSVKIDPADYPRLLKDLYAQTIGTNLASASPNPNLTPTPNPPPASISPAPASPSIPPPNVTILPSVEVSALAPVTRPVPRIFIKGGELLMHRTFALATVVVPQTKVAASVAAAAKPTPVSPIPTGQVSEGTTPPNEPTQAEMETALLARIQITPDDLRALMQARAQNVQASLVNSGKVEGERLFILAPRPISLSSQGQARANLSLE